MILVTFSPSPSLDFDHFLKGQHLSAFDSERINGLSNATCVWERTQSASLPPDFFTIRLMQATLKKESSSSVFPSCWLLNPLKSRFSAEERMSRTRSPKKEMDKVELRLSLLTVSRHKLLMLQQLPTRLSHPQISSVVEHSK